MTSSIQGSGSDNVGRVEAGQPVDPINAQFYSRFQYPWPPLFIRRLAEPGFESDMLSQSVGEWVIDILPAGPRIWVAGCGTNQAVLTAVRFPAAQVLGTDISMESLAASQRLAEQLGVTNLNLRAESINDAAYDGEFDYVISTGVIHHNADPQATLSRISRALKPDGLLELMVYNRYHCIEATAIQNAVRILASAAGGSGFEGQLELAHELMEGREDLKRRVGQFFVGMDRSEAALADALIQPVAYTFNVLELQRLAAACGLDLLLPCVNQFDVARNCFDWDVGMPDGVLRAAYETLGDTLRWQVINLVGQDQSPMLWFYLRRVSSARPRRSEREIVDQFGDQVFEIAETSSRVFLRTEEGTYQPAGQLTRYPGRPPDETCHRIIGIVAERERVRLRDVLAELGISSDFTILNRLRVRLTTTAFPYLSALARNFGDVSACD
jgi:SAM-dependent methyltransferase